MARLEAPVTNTSRRAPASRASSTAYWISGLSTMGSISLGLALVAGRKRVPRPATGKTATSMRLSDCLATIRAPLLGAGNIPRQVVVSAGPRAGRRERLRAFTSPTAVGHALRRGLGGFCHRRRGRGGFVPTELDIRAVLVDELLRDALDHGELVDALERPVLLAVTDDGLGLRGTDSVQRLGERRGIGRVHVDGL